MQSLKLFGPWLVLLLLTPNLASATLDADFLTQKVPTSLAPGATATVVVGMQNTGTEAWTQAANIKLGTQGLPKNPAIWGMDRVLLGPGETIAPGEKKFFTFTITAPLATGPYPFRWRMLQEGNVWFGDFTPTVMIDVQGVPPLDAEFLRQTVPEALAPGEQGTVSITVRNAGSTIWTEQDLFRLGSQEPSQDSQFWGPNRVLLSAGEGIANGGVKHFLFTITAPGTPGVYDFQWRMVQEGVAWFGEPSPLAAIRVQPATVQPVPRIVSQDVPVIDPGFWDPIDQNGIIFGTSSTIAFDPRSGEDKLFLVPQIVTLSLGLDGTALEPVVGNDFKITNPQTGWEFPHCREDAAVFILPVDAIETPLSQVAGVLDDESAIRPHACEQRPDGLLGWHYSPGTLVDVVEPHLGGGLDFAFIPTSKSPDAAIFSEVVLLISDANEVGVGATGKFREWQEVSLFKLSSALEAQGVLIPEVILARKEIAVSANGDGHTVITWPGFAQLWTVQGFGTTPLFINYNVDLDEWTTWLTDSQRWYPFNNRQNPEVDIVPWLRPIGIPKDFVFNRIAGRWELWLANAAPHASDPSGYPPGCQLETWPYQRQVGGEWVDHQRGPGGVRLLYRPVQLRGLILGDEVQLQSDFRAAVPDYPTGRQGAGVLFKDGQAYLHTSHRDRNICELPSSPLDSEGECGYCSWMGLYTTVERLIYQ